MASEQERLAALKEQVVLRSRLLNQVRQFFLARDYLEVQTPIRLRHPAMELNIDVMPSGDQFLRTSPELHMKRMLCAGFDKIFQIGSCFREGESGDRHEPEFTLIEWYCTGADYRDMLEETHALLGSLDARYADPWPTFSVGDLFLKHAGWDPRIEEDPDRFDLDLVERIEPQLPDGPVVLIDFPVWLAAMAKTRGEVAERWELYLDRVELANAYTELTNAEEQRQRFVEWQKGREALGKAVYPVDEPFLAAVAQGMPEAGGVALGLDRLLMAISGVSSFSHLLGFRDGN